MHGGHFSFLFHLQTPKISRTFLVCLGNRALAAWTTVLTFLLDKAFLARLLSSFLITCSALRLTPRVNPAFKPLSVLPGVFKGFRLFLSPWKPPRTMSPRIPRPAWYSSGRNRDKLPPSMLTKSPFLFHWWKRVQSLSFYTPSRVHIDVVVFTVGSLDQMDPRASFGACPELF